MFHVERFAVRTGSVSRGTLAGSPPKLSPSRDDVSRGTLTQPGVPPAGLRLIVSRETLRARSGTSATAGPGAHKRSST